MVNLFPVTFSTHFLYSDFLELRLTKVHLVH
jgi:hypothetical protein